MLLDIPDDLDLRLINFVKKRKMSGEKTTKVKSVIRLVSEALRNHE